MFTPSFIPSGEHSLLFRKMDVQTEDLHPWGIIHPQRQFFKAKLAPKEKLAPTHEVGAYASFKKLPSGAKVRP
jgi:hypothetical protein